MGCRKIKTHILVKGILATGEKLQVDGPRGTPFTIEANALNADHFNDIRKRIKGHYEGEGDKRRWIWDKQYIWFNEEISIKSRL